MGCLEQPLSHPCPGIVGPPQRPETKLSPEFLLWESREGRGKKAVQTATTP